MIDKSMLAYKIQQLQNAAASLCRSCKHNDSGACSGAKCRAVMRILHELDPLVSAYFRLEITEKRLLPPPPGVAHRQCLLPFSVATPEIRQMMYAALRTGAPEEVAATAAAEAGETVASTEVMDPYGTTETADPNYFEDIEEWRRCAYTPLPDQALFDELLPSLFRREYHRA